jgi:hypothetical protein
MSEFIKIKQIEGLSADLATRALDAQVVKIANNLSDVNAGTARTNLSLYSKTEVDALVIGARNAFNVADTTARNALTGLKVTDRVFVNDDGDTKWALYNVTAVTTGTGSTSTFKKIADEDLFTNALTAAAVKASYESNADTFAFNGTYKGKLDKITVAANVNLDTIKSTADSALANAATAQSTANSASTAASSAQSTANSASTAAAAAQTTANNAATAAATAQSTANGKEDAFTETIETFTALTGAANTAVSVTLSQTPKAGFNIHVFFNGVRVKTTSNTGGSRNLTFTVPYLTEPTDDIVVNYSY